MAGFHRGFPVVGDLELTEDGRDIVFVAGAAKVLQNIRIRAQVFKGSWRYDLNAGMPYFQEILVAGANMALVRQRFYEMLIDTDGVTGVQNLTVHVSGETLLVNFTVTALNEKVSGSLAFA